MLDATGVTVKTFLLISIISLLYIQEMKVIVAKSSGVAATLLIGFATAH